MKTRIALSILTAALALASTASAADYFARVGADYTKFEAIDASDNFDDWEVGTFGEIGMIFGEKSEHSLGLEVGYVESEGDFVGFETKKTQVPLLVNYRYTYGFAGKYAVFIGPTLGVIRDSYEIDTTNPLSSGKETNWILAYGATAGFKAQFTPNWALDLGVRVLRVEHKEYSGIGTANLTFSEDDTYTRPSFSVSVNYQF